MKEENVKITYNDEKYKIITEELETKLDTERKKWKNDINELVKQIRKTEDIVDSQIKMLSFREIFVEKLSEYKSLSLKQSKKFDVFYKDQYREYTINYDIKLSPAEKNQFIKSDLGNLKVQIDLIENQIDFFKESIKTMDAMSFAINNRVKLAEQQII